MALQDERTVPRHARVRQIALRFSPAEFLSTGIEELARGGMFVRTDDPPLPGTQVALTLGLDGPSPKPEEEIALPAVVAHTRSDGVGVKFEPLSPDRREALEQLRRLAESRIAAAAGPSPTRISADGGVAVTPLPAVHLLAPGTLVDGRYRILAHLASGGMGEVYSADHVYMRRTLALKLLHPEFGNDAEMAVRFQREAQIASSLDHPNIVRVFDFGKTSDGKLFLAMELVVGEQLEDLVVRDGAMAPERSVALLGQICDAVGDAHAHGIIHRDLKLANVIVARRQDQEVAKVLDFGIARLADEASTGGKSVTRRGIVVGTPEYLSPEQALGQPIDARADVYALGVMAYTLLAGRLPFFSENLRHVVTMHLTQPPPPLTDFAPQLGRYPALCAAILRALEKDRERRFASAGAFGLALREGLVGRAAAEPASAPARPAAPVTPEATPTATPCARCGQGVPGGDRFCPACGAPTAPPCPRCQNPTSPGARFCPACGIELSPRTSSSARFAAAPATDPADQTALRLREIGPLLPPRTLDAMMDARSQIRGEERRYVTALWLALPAGPDRPRVLASSLLAVHEGGGVVNLVGEDHALAFFGALTPRDDDAYRAIGAGLEIQRRAAGGTGPRVRVGLNAGVAVPGQTAADGETAGTGTAGLARMLAEAAPSGCVLAAAAFVEEAGPYVQVSPGPLIQADGAGEPLPSVRVDGFRTPARVNRPVLCGREKELGALLRLAVSTEGGKTRPLLLVGEEGIGKSRLVEELRRTVEGRGWTVAAAHRDPEAGAPFAAVGELVLELLRVPRAARHQALREALTGALKPAGDRAVLEQVAGVSPRLGRLRPGAVAGAVKALEGVLTRERPALLLFEDVERLDPGSREVFRLLCDTHKPVGSLILGTSRTDLAGGDAGSADAGRPRPPVAAWPQSVSTYRLPPLTADASRALIRSILGDAEIPEQLAAVAAQARGMPRLIVDDLHLLLDQQVLVEGPRGIFLVQEPKDLPSTALELARSRIHCLPADERYLLQVAALGGQAFDGQLLKRILIGLDVAELIKDAQARGILVHGLGHAQFQFVTEAMREAFVGAVAPTEAPKLHRHLADSLRRQAVADGTPVPEGRAARHLASAGDHPGALQGFVRAAGQDLAARNLAGASAWLVEAGGEALQIGGESGSARAAECFARAASLAAAAGEVELAERPLQQAEALLPAIADPTIQSEIRLAQAAVARAHFDARGAHAAAQQAFTAFRGAIPTKRLALLAAQAGAAALAAGDAHEAIQLLGEALPVAETDRFAPWFGILDLQAQILTDLGSAHAHLGSIGAAADHLDQALRRVRPRRDFAAEVEILRRLAALAEKAGELPSAASHHKAATEAAETAGDLETAALELYALARVRFRLGLAADARSCAAQATELCQQIGWEEGLALARGLFDA